MEGAEDGAGASTLFGRGAHHLRRGLNHAARLGGHGWQRISSVAATANAGGRLTRPAGALWQRVARRPSGASAPVTDGAPAHRNRRLAFDFAVVAAAVAILLVLHHQIRGSRGPRVAEAMVASSDAPPDRSSQDPSASAGVHHHRRHSHKPAAPVDGVDTRASDSHPSDPVALTAEHKDADHAGDFGDHMDAVRHDLPPVDHQVKAVPQEIPHDLKHEADAALDSLLAAPVASSAPHHDDKAAPLAQTEPPPSGDFDKPAHPHHASEPLLVDSRDPAPALPEKREHLKQSAASEPLSDDFGGPDARKHEHHEAKDHGPKDSGLKDDFALPAPAAAPIDSQPPIDDAHAHKHHHADHGPGDSPVGGDLAA
ncbi:MAG TPA: hypothetical protein VEI07_09575, partial [Planctomycetaceae bacterium]|nr:hypothetical protein [Planctomycetaceae bacterium]